MVLRFFTETQLDLTNGMEVGVVTALGWEIAQGLLSQPDDPSLGGVVGVIVDAAGVPLAGATVNLSSGGIVGYMPGGYPDPAATETDTTGKFLIVHAPLGSATLTAISASASATMALDVFPDAITNVCASP